ncbi:MAG: hypothetical protein MUE64_01630 [Ignavibacteriaceae bacterium]|jgi:hypothetical protein|nr:hypothetical protein [Ignavibacteriaceae bacterium]
MGKGLLIVALGMSVIISFFILKLNANSKENLSTTINMFEQTQARLIANSGIEVFLEKLKHDRSMMNKNYPNNSLFGGTYDISISGPDSLVQVTSRATFMSVKHTTVVEAAADKVPLYPGPGAMYLSTGTVAGLKKNAINGSIEINGNNHDINGNLISGGSSVPGIAVDGETQRNSVINMITKNTIDQVLGSGGMPSVTAINNTVNWSEYALLVANNPDIIIDTQEKVNTLNTWGTLTDPKVTFVNGDIKLNNSQAASGCGILVVNGSLEINGGFDYKGLVIAYKNTSIDIKLNGNAQILGSLVVAGTQINVDVSSGNFSALYSTEALNLIEALLVTKRFSILSWWE